MWITCIHPSGLNQLIPFAPGVFLFLLSSHDHYGNILYLALGYIIYMVNFQVFDILQGKEYINKMEIQESVKRKQRSLWAWSLGGLFGG